MRAEPPLGAQLVTPRRGYTHHGLYVGDGKVVHYAGLSGALLAGPIEEVPVARFACGHKVWIEPGLSPKYTGAEVVRRARSRLGENHYRLLTNNCEHFCMWCLCGVARSAQVDRCLAFPRLFLGAIFHQIKVGGAMSLRRSICSP
ncbi:lecithin retinol acyltransferase family protein [Cupriavidus sp. 8B]